MRKLFLATAMTIGLAMAPKPAQAFLIEGEIDLAGGIRITSDGLLDFIPPVAPSTTDCPSATDCGLASIATVGNDGYFAVFNGGFVYHIAELDLSAADFPAGPIGTFDELLDFETTPNSVQGFFLPDGSFVSCGGTICPSPLPELTLSLTSITLCSEGCTFGFAPQFNVTFIDGNTAVIMNITGIVCDPGNPLAECNTYKGIFTAQFPNQSPTQLIDLLDSNGYIETSFSASKITTGFVSTVPEPTSLLLFGTGTAVFAGIRRRRAAKAKKAAEADQTTKL